MTTRRDFVKALGGRVAGFDQPPVGDPGDVVAACALDLDPIVQAQFLEAFADDWQMLIVAHCDHPELLAIGEWAEAQEGVLFLASPSGPPPPAVFIFEN